MTVHIQPNAARAQYAGLHGDALKFRVPAPPAGGAANDALSRHLTDRFDLPKKGAWAVLIMLGLAACAGPKPILYPNAHFQAVGQDASKQDIAECKQMAEAAGVKSNEGKTGQVAGSTVAGAGVGAASGAVGGAVVGAAGRGSAIGAASGATAGLLRGLFFRWSNPNQGYKNFVDRCLQDKGYEPVGWE